MSGTSSAERLRRHLEAERAKTRAKLTGVSVTDAELRRVSDAAIAAAAVPKEAMAPLASSLPASARLATGSRDQVLSPKIWAEDLKRWAKARFPRQDWLRRCRTAARKRRRGDVLEPTIIRLCDILSMRAVEGGGKAEMTFLDLRHLVGCCVETARKVIRWLEEQDLLDTFNVLARVGNDLRRGANLYLPRLDAPEAAPVAAPEDPTTDTPASKLTPVARLTARLERWASRFGLTPRAWGLNATPIATRHYRPSDPAPA